MLLEHEFQHGESLSQGTSSGPASLEFGCRAPLIQSQGERKRKRPFVSRAPSKPLEQRRLCWHERAGQTLQDWNQVNKDLKNWRTRIPQPKTQIHEERTEHEWLTQRRLGTHHSAPTFIHNYWYKGTMPWLTRGAHSSSHSIKGMNEASEQTRGN